MNAEVLLRSLVDVPDPAHGFGAAQGEDSLDFARFQAALGEQLMAQAEAHLEARVGAEQASADDAPAEELPEEQRLALVVPAQVDAPPGPAPPRPEPQGFALSEPPPLREGAAFAAPPLQPRPDSRAGAAPDVETGPPPPRDEAHAVLRPGEIAARTPTPRTATLPAEEPPPPAPSQMPPAAREAAEPPAGPPTAAKLPAGRPERAELEADRLKPDEASAATVREAPTPAPPPTRGAAAADAGPAPAQTWVAQPPDAPPPAPERSAAPFRPAGGVPAGVEEMPLRVEWLAQRGGGTARVDLHPPHLGRVELAVRLKGSEVEVTIVAHEGAASSLVSGQRDQLADALTARELRLSHFEVSDGSPREDGDARREALERRGDPEEGADRTAAPRIASASPPLPSQVLEAPSPGGVDLHI